MAFALMGHRPPALRCNLPSLSQTNTYKNINTLTNTCTHQGYHWTLSSFCNGNKKFALVEAIYIVTCQNKTLELLHQCICHRVSLFQSCQSIAPLNDYWSLSAVKMKVQLLSTKNSLCLLNIFYNKILIKDLYSPVTPGAYLEMSKSSLSCSRTFYHQHWSKSTLNWVYFPDQ